MAAALDALAKVRQDHGDATVAHDGGQPPGGCIRVERDVACPGLQRPEYAHDGGGRLDGEDPHAIARRHALGEECAGYLVAQPVQFGVGQRPVARSYRRPIRLPCCAIRQQVLQKIRHFPSWPVSPPPALVHRPSILTGPASGTR